MHWSAHDTQTRFQPGATFTHRRNLGGTVVERFVWAAQEDERWLFKQSGLALPEEDVTLYNARRKRDGLNKQRVTELLPRLGARPWQEDFYAEADQHACLITRDRLPPDIITRCPEMVLARFDDGSA
jgi:hypothetical protein